MKNIIINFILPVVAAIMLVFTIVSISRSKEEPKREVLITPSQSSFKNKVAGSGIVEPETNIINVGTHITGILKKIYVEEGDFIKKNAPLFSIDDRDTLASLAQANARVKVALVNFKDQEHHLKLFENIKDKRAISTNELSRKRFAVEKAKAELAEAIANVEKVKTTLERLTVRSPIDSHVLKVNVRLGEFIDQNRNNVVPIIIGNLDKMRVRVSVDESDIHRLDEDAPAVGTLRGHAKIKVPLQFVKYEPYVIPKKNLSGNVNEKIDVRVLELIYEFDNSRVGAIPGQQMDIYIQEKVVREID